MAASVESASAATDSAGGSASANAAAEPKRARATLQEKIEQLSGLPGLVAPSDVDERHRERESATANKVYYVLQYIFVRITIYIYTT